MGLVAGLVCAMLLPTDCKWVVRRALKQSQRGARLSKLIISHEELTDIAISNVSKDSFRSHNIQLVGGYIRAYASSFFVVLHQGCNVVLATKDPESVT